MRIKKLTQKPPISKLLLIMLCLYGVSAAQTTNSQIEARLPLDEIRLFQNFLRDAPILPKAFGEGIFTFSDLGNGTLMDASVQGAVPFNPQFQLGANIGLANRSFSGAGSEFGAKDITVSGVYNLTLPPPLFSVGSYLTIPIGSDRIGHNRLNFGGFAAIRYALHQNFVLSGTLGLDFTQVKRFVVTNYIPGAPPGALVVKEEKDYDAALLLGGGAIIRLTPQLSLVSELNLRSEGNYLFFSSGADYLLASGYRLRGALGFGLDSGAPDFQLMVSYLISL